MLVTNDMLTNCLIVVFAPLIGAIVAGLGCRVIPRWLAHTATILGVAVSCFYSYQVLMQLMAGGPALYTNLYTWAQFGDFSLSIGFMVDKLTATMMLVVTSVSLMVHIYTIGYMHEDGGYNRFFGLISLFTFAMLMLVMANNFLQLFFGWEAVGLVSYLLIGFWFTKPSAVFANLKAFLVNRVGDLGFLLGIAMVFAYFGSLDYQTVFEQASSTKLAGTVVPFLGTHLDVMTLMTLLLFVGAMGKSAQVPLHVWLPDSMEGPTPISALIHAATMVTAGVFMVTRMSPLFELSSTALNVIMAIGATTCFFMGLLGIVQHDIKRVVAYSTLSQLGYMVTALGASAYAAGIFHLATHAFFKALLFLGAGSVIVALHHQQDMRQMGGLWKKMPITWLCMLIGTLALTGVPFLSGFYSKDLIIEAVELSQLPSAHWAHLAVLSSVFVTSFYSFRLLILVFHGKSRMTQEQYSHAHETPIVVWGPLVLLAIPSVLLGAYALLPVLEGFWGSAIFVDPSHDVLAVLAHHVHSSTEMALNAVHHAPFWLSMSGAFSAIIIYQFFPGIPATAARALRPVHVLLSQKYFFDWFNEQVLARLIRFVGWLSWRVGDELLIDGAAVNGSASVVSRLSQQIRQLQSGYIYHYAFAMILGALGLLLWFVFR
ncbi:MAG: NADH-quinone oxidoreductase subunit L [Legionellales bacterium]|nr:NADH-quinone oxidoreductase subunit L [Legionellales bacterium]